MGLQLLVSIRFQVLFHSPNRGAFHLSLTVLCSLSVMYEYLGLEGGPPMFRQDFTCPALLKDLKEALPIRGYHPLWRAFPDASGCLLTGHWPGPRSLVTTNGVSVDVLSSG